MAFITDSLARFVLLAGFVAGISAGWFTPARAADSTATVTATIVAPIVIAKKSELAFASIVPHAVSPGTVVVSSDGSITCGPNLSCSRAPEPSGFSITGEPLNTFTITLPSGAQTIIAGDKSMTVDRFTSSPESTGVISSDGQATVNVGATLHVGANQPIANYTGSFDIDLDYP